jgi:hypothetical protein
MAVQFQSTLRVQVGAALVGAMVLSACGQAAPEAVQGDPEAAPAPVAAAPAAVEDALTPAALILRALECHRPLNAARTATDRLPADVNARIAQTPELHFNRMVFAGSRLGLTIEERREAHSSGRAMPRTGNEIEPDYLTYLSACADITDRAAQAIAATEIN